MSQPLGEMIPMAIVIAAFPIPIIAIVLILTSSRARVNGPFFAIGWFCALCAIGAVTLAIADGADVDAYGAPATWVIVVKFAVALALLGIAWHTFATRPRPGETPEIPRWMGAIDSMSARRAFESGAALAGLNPKNLLLAAAGAASIARTGVPGAQQALWYLLFALIASCGIGAPLLMFFIFGERVVPTLNRLKAWMGRNMAILVSALCVLIATKLILDAIAGTRS